MSITQIQLENITVFEKLDVTFEKGLNIFIGENGMGKTHIMKLLYSACQAVKQDISFPNKIARVFQPDHLRLQRLISRKNSDGAASIKVFSEHSGIAAKFTKKLRSGMRK